MDRFDNLLDKILVKFEEKIEKVHGELHDTNVRMAVVVRSLESIVERIGSQFHSLRRRGGLQVNKVIRLSPSTFNEP